MKPYRILKYFMLLALMLPMESGFYAHSKAFADDRALLVGIGVYALEGGSLPGIDKDVRMMRETVRMMGFEDNQVRVLQDSRATLNNIIANIRDWLINGAGPEDRVLFYYSGHGSQIKDKDGDEADGVDEVLMPHDTGMKGNKLVNVLVDDVFGRLLSQIRARETMVFIDACHSGTATKGLRLMEGQSIRSLYPADAYPKYFYYKGMPQSKASFAKDEASGRYNYIALSAARDDEVAIATRQGSLFTRGLFASLKRAATNKQPLSVARLREETAAYISANHPRGTEPHSPQVIGDKRLAATDIIRVNIRHGRLWTQLERLASKAVYRIELSSNKRRYRVRDVLIISCRADRSGYLNIINVNPTNKEATVLFPNRYHPDNRIAANTTLRIPAQGDRFVLRAQPPSGKTLLVAFHTQRNINAYRDGIGKMGTVFKTLSQKSVRGFVVEEKRDSGSFGAGVLIADIMN